MANWAFRKDNLNKGCSVLPAPSHVTPPSCPKRWPLHQTSSQATGHIPPNFPLPFPCASEGAPPFAGKRPFRLSGPGFLPGFFSGFFFEAETGVSASSAKALALVHVPWALVVVGEGRQRRQGREELRGLQLLVAEAQRQLLRELLRHWPLGISQVWGKTTWGDLKGNMPTLWLEARNLVKLAQESVAKQS